MRLIAIFYAFSAAVLFANPPAPEVKFPGQQYIPLLRHGEVVLDPTLQQKFIDREKEVFDAGVWVRPFDVEEDHVRAAKRYVEAITNPSLSQQDLMAVLWINGQQIAALQRQNKIYMRSKGSPKWASMVFEKEIEKQLTKHCSKSTSPKECLSGLKEKALKMTEIFWADFKKQAEDDFTKNKLDKKRITFHQMRGHMREAYRNPDSPVWIAINDYVQAFQSSKAFMPAQAEAVEVPLLVKPKPIIPGIELPALHEAEKKKKGIGTAITDAKKNLVRKLGLEPKVEEVAEEKKPWNYVNSNSSNDDLYRATSRYADQVVRSLGCNYFDDASLLNGQIIARLVRKGSVDLAKITQLTNKAVENWCYSQLSTAEKIIECKDTLSPLMADLNKYYWQEIKEDIEKSGKKATTAEVDNYFAQLKSSAAIKNSEHRLGQLNFALQDALTKIKGDWDYQCLSLKDEALGDYRVIKATQEQRVVVDNLLKHLKGNPLKSPPGYCARAVKTAMHSAGIFKSYPGWVSAKHMAKGFEDENVDHVHLGEGYELRRVDTLNPDEAPGYAVIVYGGKGDGHVEVKVPVAELRARGIATMLGYGQKKISIDDREFAYVSDYIDAAPRSSPKSRTGRGDGSDNGRPVLGIYVIMRKS